MQDALSRCRADFHANLASVTAQMCQNLRDRIFREQSAVREAESFILYPSSLSLLIVFSGYKCLP